MAVTLPPSARGAETHTQRVSGCAKVPLQSLFCKGVGANWVFPKEKMYLDPYPTAHTSEFLMDYRSKYEGFRRKIRIRLCVGVGNLAHLLRTEDALC